MLLPVLGLYNVHVVRRCGHDLGQRSEQRFAVVDRQTQKIGDKQTALWQLRVRTRDGDDLIAQRARGLDGVDAFQLQQHAGLLHARLLDLIGFSVQIERVELQQKFRAVGPGQKLDLAMYAMRADDLSGLQIGVFHSKPP